MDVICTKLHPVTKRVRVSFDVYSSNYCYSILDFDLHRDHDTTNSVSTIITAIIGVITIIINIIIIETYISLF